jgi:hypothetical protein
MNFEHLSIIKIASTPKLWEAEKYEFLAPTSCALGPRV